MDGTSAAAWLEPFIRLAGPLLSMHFPFLSISSSKSKLLAHGIEQFGNKRTNSRRIRMCDARFASGMVEGWNMKEPANGSILFIPNH